MPENEPETHVYMTDDLNVLRETRASRSALFPPDLREQWREAVPETRTGPWIVQPHWPCAFRETIMYILGHEAMSNYQRRYMETMAEIATRQGGDILEVGYGLGIATAAIEKRRRKRKIQTHYVIELNRHLAEVARRVKNVTVMERDYNERMPEIEGKQFDGILYDGYPLSFDDIHRDGVIFIERVAEQKMLKPDGVLTFYTDSAQELGRRFLTFLRGLGFQNIQTKQVPITPPRRKRQVWRQDHFIAPIVRHH